MDDNDSAIAAVMEAGGVSDALDATTGDDKKCDKEEQLDSMVDLEQGSGENVTEEEVPHGAFHAGLDYGDDGPNARDVFVPEDESMMASNTIVDAPVEEVSATLVDEDEENRRIQSRIDEEVERQRQEERENVEVASVVKGFWCSRRFKIVGSVALFFAILGVVLGVVLWKVLQPETPSPLPELMQLLSSVSFDNGNALQTPGTPQNDALYWLANNNTDLDTYSDERKIQRYALATLYLSTNGDDWTDNADWMTDRSECLWFNKIPKAQDICSNTTYLANLDLEDNNLSGTLPVEIALLTSLGKQ